MKTIFHEVSLLSTIIAITLLRTIPAGRILRRLPALIRVPTPVRTISLLFFLPYFLPRHEFFYCFSQLLNWVRGYFLNCNTLLSAWCVWIYPLLLLQISVGSLHFAFLCPHCGMLFHVVSQEYLWNDPRFPWTFGICNWAPSWPDVSCGQIQIFLTTIWIPARASCVPPDSYSSGIHELPSQVIFDG